MLNRVIIMGRITRDLELKQTQTGVSVLSFTVAVDRNFVKQGEERQADFINCVAWRQQAEFISRFFGKGRMIAIEGNIRTRSYEDNNGNKRTATEVYVDSVCFTGEKAVTGQASSKSEYDEINRNAKAYAPSPGVLEPEPDINYTLEAEGILSDDGVPF